MKTYLLKRLLILPVTLFAIILVNFVILNLSSLDPVSGMNRSPGDEANRSESESSYEEQYILFREHYGLTLPILFNTWPSTSYEEIKKNLLDLLKKKESGFSEYHKKYTLWGDKARFLKDHLLKIAEDQNSPIPLRKLSLNLFVRGATRKGWIGPSLSQEKKEENKKIATDNALLYTLKAKSNDDEKTLSDKMAKLKTWHQHNAHVIPVEYSLSQRVNIFFFETRFAKYISKVATLDFGTLRNDQNKLVVHEVFRRIKYSLTLSVIPMIMTFLLASFFGMVMAIYQNKWLDISLNTLFLILFSIPAFVAAPFLIEKVALSNLSLPIGGFHSQEKVYSMLTSWSRFKDIGLHLILPLTCIMYATMAVQSRLSRTSMLNVMRQDHVRTAHAKGLSFPTLMLRHVGKNGAIPLVTSLASSLGLILGGSLIIETVFEINGFGRFFYDAVVNRDYNVVLFSAFAGSLLTLLGYLIADICYTLLDPRIRFDK